MTREAKSAETALRRLSARIVQAIPITLSGVDAIGQPFKERTSTVTISCHGCKYHSKHYVPKNSTVVIEVMSPNAARPPRSVRAIVVWFQRPRTVRELFQVGVEFEIPGNVWDFANPPADWLTDSNDSIGENVGITRETGDQSRDWIASTVESLFTRPAGAKSMASQERNDVGNPREAPHDFEVALSFAGEDRNYVERTARALTRKGIKAFYDKHEAATLWGKDLFTHLDSVYRHRSNYTVMFISKYYASKLWTNHERKSAQARAFIEIREYILPARFDDTEIPGLLPTVGYIDLRVTSPARLAELIATKVRSRR